MKNTLVVLGIILLLCSLLVLINYKTEQSDNFTNDLIEPVLNIVQSRSGIDDPILRGIVAPTLIDSLKVTPKDVSDNTAKPSDIFNETKIIRPIEVQNGLDSRSINNKIEYNKVNSAINSFKLPVLPNDLITSKKYTELDRFELENRSIKDIHSMMLDNVIDHVDKVELDRIQGAYMDNYSTVNNLYSTEYTSYQAVDFNKDIEYKYKPYDGNSFRSL